MLFQMDELVELRPFILKWFSEAFACADYEYGIIGRNHTIGTIRTRH